MDHQGAINGMTTFSQIFVCGIEGAISYGHIVRRYWQFFRKKLVTAPILRRQNISPSRELKHPQLQIDRLCRRLQDHERVKGGDLAVTAHVSGIVERADANRDFERDCGICGGESVVVVEVAAGVYYYRFAR